MSTFEIDTEIDKLVDKLTDQFKTKLKKLIARSEKLVLKQYIASQKETLRVTTRKQTKVAEGRSSFARKTRSVCLRPREELRSPKDRSKGRVRVRKKVASGPLRRERDYRYQENDSADD